MKIKYVNLHKKAPTEVMFSAYLNMRMRITILLYLCVRLPYYILHIMFFQLLTYFKLIDFIMHTATTVNCELQDAC